MFNKKSVGLDISDKTIELVELSKKRKEIVINSFNRIKLDEGLVVNGDPKKPEEIKKILKELFANAKPNSIYAKDIIFGLQDGLTYALNIFLKGYSKKDDPDNAIIKEIKDNIPLPADGFLYSHKITHESKNGIDVLVIVANKKKVLAWQKILNELGAEEVLYDPMFLANMRGILLNVTSKPVCMIDIGENFTSVSTFDKSGLKYTFSIPSAGANLTKQIAKELKITFEQAEIKKIEVGISNNKKNVKITNIIINFLESLVVEITQADQYYFGKQTDKIDAIYLIGGTSQLKGLSLFFKEKLGRNVFFGGEIIKKNENIKTPIKNFNNQLFIGAIGLGIRGLDKSWDKIDPKIDLKDIPKIANIKIPIKVKAVPVKEEDDNNNHQLLSVKKNTVVKLEKKYNTNKNKKLMLLLILLIGLLLILISYIIRNYYKDKNVIPTNTIGQTEFVYPLKLTLTVPVAVNTDEYTVDRVKGRILFYEVTTASEYLNILSQSRVSVENLLSFGEAVWNQSINQPTDINSIEYPTQIKWLVYSQSDARRLLLQKVKTQIGDVKFLLENLSFTNLTNTENVNIFELESKIEISTNQILQNYNEKNTAVDNIADQENVVVEAPIIAIKNITILSTPTGYLNVRSGAGVTFEKIAEVKPNEEYEYIQEKDGWVEFKLSSNTNGWVSSQYIKLPNQ